MKLLKCILLATLVVAIASCSKKPETASQKTDTSAKEKTETVIQKADTSAKEKTASDTTDAAFVKVAAAAAATIAQKRIQLYKTRRQ
jgi:hypothetical protein